MNLNTRQLDALARATITALELVSTTKASTLEQKIHGGTDHNDAKLPQHIEAPHLYYRNRYEGCRTDEQRRNVIADALAELRHIRYSRRPTVDLQTREGRLTVGLDKRPLSVVAHSYSYSEQHVRRLRREAAAVAARYRAA
jgi:hypothetical protein